MDLWTTLTGASRRSLHVWTGRGFESARWTAVVRDAELTTAALRRAGVRPGRTVAAVLTNGPQVVRGILGTWLAGGAVASLPVPARGMDADEYAQQLEAICAQLDPVVFLIEERMLELLPEPLRRRFGARSWESLAVSGRVEPSPPGADDLAFVQYSSGSTSTPKGCMLTPRAIAAQLELIWTMIGGRPGEDVGVSWLPLSHDMGLFGMLLTPWAHDCDAVLSTPERFMVSPRTWFGDIADWGGTVTAGTNTGLHVAARRTTGLARSLRLRTCIVGGERVEWETLRLATETFAPYGFEERALMPAYGLAEATLAVTAVPVDEVPRQVRLDGVALADGELREAGGDDPSATRIVSCGPPCRGVEICGAGEEALGEIEVRSPSLAVGYLGDERLTRERFHDGLLHSGDIGFARDGHLYPVGRLDDMISVGGRKIYAREVESVIDGLAGLRRGCSTLVERSEGAVGRLTLFVEVRERPDDYVSIARAAAEVAMAKAAVPLDQCLFLEKGSLPKTPSGKIQRHRCRRLADDGRFDPLAEVELART